MENDTTVSAAYIFRGIEYIVTMTVKDDSVLMVEVEDKLTADQWRAEFDAAYVEDLTHKTGNFKQFSIFVSMLESGIIQASESVSLDLLTYADLESLRQRKAGSAAKSMAAPQRTVSLNSKRYLILTYTVEFDRIHYPLPLPYVGKPDPRQLQEQVRNLRAEVKSLKQQGPSETKVKDVEKLRREMEALQKEKEDIETEFLQFRREMKNTTQGNALKELKMFKSMTRQLEEELMKEKTKHQRQVSKHSQQYRDLLEELEEVRASERNLKIRVKSLTNELALYKRDKVHTSRQTRPYSRERTSSYDRISSRERSLSRDRERSLSRDRSWSDRLSSARDRSRDRSRDGSLERPSSVNRSRLSDRSNGYKNSYSHRSRTPSPSPAGARNPRFDPSAYVKEKERKKKETVLKRKRQQRANTSGTSVLSNKPSPGVRLANSRLSANSRNRSRNTSYGSQGEMSDGGMSDSSYSSLRNYNRGRPSRPRSRSRQNERSALSSAYLSSPDVPKKSESKTKKNSKILASTPDSEYGRTRSVRNKENIPASNGYDSDYFDRSAEISEIDERLNRLQQLMKNSMT
ncbi:centrosomal protein CCDC61-like [Mercenaria mercenaria]|uniref:centrosomal protein CCDC61-like n=1 Tax=Mercenaria mercenaria TaxID=6596 RepID=UPI00234ED58D|nr:centrosomal protein CCDC61-like [Mercenaria mercenaria]